ncbi:MAG: glycosyltransferase family 4 protein [Prevotella sp.]|nr:glycosyltransferase family 4 protein [Candidatus Prevotella equi]
MTKKKIAFVVAIAGTAQAFLKDHMTYLVKEYDVHLVANFKPEEKGEFEQMGVTCHDAPIRRSIKLGADLKALFALRKIFKKEKFECVHSVTPKAGLLTSVAGWMAGVPNRVHIFTGQVWATRKGVMRSILKGMDKMIAKFDNEILVDGQGQRLFLINEGVLKESNSTVLANGSIAGVKLERFVISEETRKVEREKLGFKEDDVCFIFMGRLNHDKGIGELYEAFDKLIPECPKAKLVLYGHDEEGYDPKAETFINIKRDVNYFYPGHTSVPFASLQAGDVFVLPTWREGFGMSVLEAQGLALPAITSDAYGVVDATAEGTTALRFHVGDAEGLGQCMKKYYNDPELRKEHGLAGRKRVEESFVGSKVSEAWVDFYHKLLK